MKALRIKQGYTQKQLATRIGISQVYISKIERGDARGLTIDKLTKLADALQVTPMELLEKLLSTKEDGWYVKNEEIQNLC